MEVIDALNYDPTTGVIAWKVFRGSKIKPGFVAGYPNSDGYTKIVFMGKTYSAHRLAFIFMTGSYPPEEVDHIDGDPQNNKWDNLRACTRQENMQNKLQNNHSQRKILVGASRMRDKWLSRISNNGKQIHIGVFDTELEAHEAYLERKAELHKFNPVPRNLK